MKTLDREKSERLFYEFKSLGNTISDLGCIVQNPDFINAENAEECFKDFYSVYENCSNKLDELYKAVFLLYDDLLNSKE